MKLKNLVVSGILVGSLLFTGCQSTQEHCELEGLDICTTIATEEIEGHKYCEPCANFMKETTDKTNLKYHYEYNLKPQLGMESLTMLAMHDLEGFKGMFDCMEKDLYILTGEQAAEYILELIEQDPDWDSSRYERPTFEYTDTCGSCGSSNIEIMDSCGAYQCYDCGFID